MTDLSGLDAPAFEAAINNGMETEYRLHGSFDFGNSTVTVKKPVTLRTPDGENEAIITNGYPAFDVQVTGSFTIKRVRFQNPKKSAIQVHQVNGLEIANCVIEKVTSVTASVPDEKGKTEIFQTAQGILIAQDLSKSQSVLGKLSIHDNTMTIGEGDSSQDQIGPDRTLGIALIEAGDATIAGDAGKAHLIIFNNRINTVTAFGIDLRNIIGDAIIDYSRIVMSNLGVGRAPDRLPFILAGIRCLGPAPYSIRWNDITCGHENSAGIRLMGNSSTAPLKQSTVAENTIKMSIPAGKIGSDLNAGIDIRRQCIQNSVGANTISGVARAALSLVAEAKPNAAGTILIPDQNTLSNNKYYNFTGSVADIVVGPGVLRTAISSVLESKDGPSFKAIPGSLGIILDQGTGTTLFGEISG